MLCGWSPGSDGLPSGRCRRMVCRMAIRLVVTVFLRTLKQNGMLCVCPILVAHKKRNILKHISFINLINIACTNAVLA